MSLTKHKNFILFLLIIALGLIAWGVMRDNSFQADVPEIESLFSDSIDKIEIQGAGNKHVLVKEEEEWRVKDGEVMFPADQEAVKAVVEEFKNFKVGEVVSRSGEKYNIFGVQGTSALQIVLYEKDREIERLYVGDTDYRRGGDYVRLGHFVGDYEHLEDFVPVYVTDTSIRSSFLKDTYKDLHLSDVDTEAVSEVAFAYADNQRDFAVVKKAIQQNDGAKDASSASRADEWFYKDDAELKQQLDKSAITTVLSGVKNNTARDIVTIDTAKDYGFEKPSIVITLTDAKGTEQISFGEQTEDKSAYYAMVTDKDLWVYEVESSFVENIFSKKKEDFLKKEEPKQ